MPQRPTSRPERRTGYGALPVVELRRQGSIAAMGVPPEALRVVPRSR
jgi:hypothetical protein